MASIDYTRIIEVTEAIVKAMAKIGKPIDASQVKVWGQDSISLQNAVTLCEFVINDFPNNKIIIYTNKVPAISYLEQNFGIEIYDEEKVKELALLVKDYKLYDLVS